MGNVVRQADTGDYIRLIVTDNLGREFAVYYEKKNPSYSLDVIRLPDGVEWDVGTFQEMIGVRDSANEYMADHDFDLLDSPLDLKNVCLFEEDPYLVK